VDHYSVDAPQHAAPTNAAAARDVQAAVEQPLPRMGCDGQQMRAFTSLPGHPPGGPALPAAPRRIPRPERAARYRRRMDIVAAITVFALCLGTVLASLGHGSQRVSAQEVWEKSVSATQNPGAAGIQNYHVKRTITSVLRGQPVEEMEEKWVALPDRMRSDTTIRIAGTVTGYQAMGLDGADRWSLERTPDTNDGRLLAVAGAADSPEDVRDRVRGAMLDDFPHLPQPASNDGLPPPTMTTLTQPTSPALSSVPQSANELLRRAAACYHPIMAGEETIAGRQAYVLDLGVSSCLAANANEREKETQHILWIDTQTFFVLKDVLTVGNVPAVTAAVTFVAFNVAVPSQPFSFVLPQEPDAIVVDVRPQPFRSANPPRTHAPGTEQRG